MYFNREEARAGARGAYVPTKFQKIPGILDTILAMAVAWSRNFYKILWSLCNGLLGLKVAKLL